MDIMGNANAFVLGLNKYIQIRQLQIIYLTLSKHYIDNYEKQFSGINKCNDMKYLKVTKLYLFEFEKIKRYAVCFLDKK